MRIFALIFICTALATPSGASSLSPVITNPGFEDGTAGWGWYTRAKAGFRSETQNPHSGTRCLVFTNESELEPEVYGRLYQSVGVLPGVEYELSVWVRGEEVASAIHFTDWDSYRLDVPEGTYDWRRITVKFHTKEDRHFLNLGINVVNRCTALAIDDVSMRAIGNPLEGEGVNGEFVSPSRVIGDNTAAPLGIFVESSVRSATVEAVIKADEGQIYRRTGPIKAGDNNVEWQWNTGDTPARELRLTVRVLDSNGKVVASGVQEIEKLGSSISVDINRAEARLEEFDDLYAKCRAKGIPLDYPSITRTMLTQFIPLAREDLQKGEQVRASNAAKDFLLCLDRAIAEMQAYLKDPDLAPNARRYQTGKVGISGLSFVGDRQDSTGKKDRGPIFFCGYGHFGQVRRDMPRWPDYGVNIIQIEVGPRITMPSENEISLDAAQDIVKVLDDAAGHNVKVNILLSPHYFPGWAMQKWPHLGKGGGGFLGFCVDASEAKQVIEKFLRTVVPLFKDKPALHSFCLSNEPVFNNTANCENTGPMWAAYLARAHGDVGTMNTGYGTDYTAFSDVPIPGNDAYDAPQFYDYCIFNQERFAEWHKWMADIIHEMAPNVPVHAKIMNMAVLMRHTVSWGVDPELFGGLSQINGNDCWMWPVGGGGWAIQWHTQNMAYDIQRSLNAKPIFNSENHLVMDRSTNYVPGEHFRTALWQGAIHGQGATTIWVWERTYDRGYDFYGSVMERPACAEAVGRTCLDLNRFAEEVTALQKARAPAAIVFSMASLARHQRYLDTAGKAYTALNFCGVKVDFISEKQLAAGKGEQYKMVVLPEATHLPRPAYDALVKLSGSVRIVIYGEAPGKDPYGKACAAAGLDKLTENALLIKGDAAPDKVWPLISTELKALSALPEVSVLGADSGDPVWGVEWLPAKLGGRAVINMVNLLDKPVDVRIVRSGKEIAARDLLSLGGRETVRRLEPMIPVLAEVGL